MQIIEKNTEKTYFLNFLRVISCLAIIFLHVQHTAVSDDPLVSDELRSIFLFLTSCIQWAVPIFFMISGYIFLGIKKECTYKSMFKHYIKLLLIIIFIYTFFNIIEFYYVEKSFSLELIIYAVKKMLTGKSWDHLWFINSIFAIYLIMPVFKLFFDKCDKNLEIFMIINFVFIYFLPTINKYLPFAIVVEYIFDWKMFYVFLGGYFAKKKIINTFINNMSMTLLLVMLFVINYISFIKGYTLTSYSNRFMVVFEASLIFLLSINLFNKYNAFLLTISKYTLSVYIFHVIFVHIMTKVLYIYPLRYMPFLSMLVAYVIITIVSFLFSKIINMIGSAINKKFQIINNIK